VIFNKIIDDYPKTKKKKQWRENNIIKKEKLVFFILIQCYPITFIRNFDLISVYMFLLTFYDLSVN
jgi:hypothetical protein